jgi:hypothetical protein
MSGIPWAGQGGSPLAELGQILGRRWAHLEEAWETTLRANHLVSKIIEDKLIASGIDPNSDTSVIMHGSLGVCRDSTSVLRGLQRLKMIFAGLAIQPLKALFGVDSRLKMWRGARPAPD